MPELIPGQTRVRVMNTEQTLELGLGTYLGEPPEREARGIKRLLMAEGCTDISSIVVIKLDSGEIIHGYECWWCVEE